MNIMTQKQQTERNHDKSGNINSDTNNSNTNNNKNDRKFETVCLDSGTNENTKYPTEKCYYRANAANRPLPWKSKPARQNRPQVQDGQNKTIQNV